MSLSAQSSEQSAELKTGYARRREGPRLYWDARGPLDAPPLLLIRGLARSSSYWLEFRDDLARTHRVVSFDNRGVGRSDTPPLPWTTADMADDAAAVLRASGTERADVFGISLGGMIAQELCLRHPHRVRRVVLAATTAGGRGFSKIRPKTALSMARAVTLPPEAALRASAKFALSAEFLARRPDAVETWVAIADGEPESRTGVAGQMLAGARHDTSRRLRFIAHRAMTMAGDADAMIDPINSVRLAAGIEGARFVNIAGGGHDFVTEQGAHCARLVSEFLTA